MSMFCHFCIRMPFSIKRLTQLHRSSSLQTKDLADKADKSKQEQNQSTKSSLIKSSKKSKHKKGSDKTSVDDANQAKEQTAPQPQVSQHSTTHRNVPPAPSYVICNQTMINSTGKPAPPTPQQQQEHHVLSNVYQGPGPYAKNKSKVSTAASSKHVNNANALPNSRSLDSNEIRRLANQSSKWIL